MTSFTLAGKLRRLGSLLYEAMLLAALLLAAAALFQPLFAWLGQPGWLHVLFQLYLLAVLYFYCDWSWRRGGQTLAMKTWKSAWPAPTAKHWTVAAPPCALPCWPRC